VTDSSKYLTFKIIEMAVNYQHEDDYYERLIKEANALGNQQLAHLIVEKANEKNEKFTQINLFNEIRTYKIELEKLK
jgi:hypothetical protein